ncbi:hypothetical protein FHX52_0107 [Humibacillus xanthopallidus]|uniref:AAA domain-containing protein n=1 Tax=Humibacillus xanthopallidus TaxID=412689 RepID=A0A543PSF8_9MICO|nr:hypothetical protein [Humibacillus xanthopallidus]TQN47017.1 hypothetical protein FHX52_0107 [Humibacillus xanthopallidus]
MSDRGPDSDRGRLFLVTGTDPEQRRSLAAALARRIGRAVVIDGEALERLVRIGSLEPWTGTPTSAQLRDRLLRWSAALAVAETHQLEGWDAVLVEDALGERLEDLLDLVDPEPVHLVVIAAGVDPSTPRWGLWVDEPTPANEAAEAAEPDTMAEVDTVAELDAMAESVLARLDEALVVTADPT